MPLSEPLRQKIGILFPERVGEVADLLLEGIGEQHVFTRGFDERDRIRTAVLKLSEGDFEKIQRAIGLAQRDWRNVLMWSGLADNPESYKSWVPSPPPARIEEK